MNKEEMRNNVALWASNKIRIQEIPFDDTIFDDKSMLGVQELLNTNFSKMAYIKGKIIACEQELYFDITSSFIQYKTSLCVDIESNTNPTRQTIFSNKKIISLYDIKNLCKIQLGSIEFNKQQNRKEAADYSGRNNLGMHFSDETKKPVAFIGILLGKNYTLTFVDVLAKMVFYGASFSENMSDVAISPNMMNVALKLLDGRILLLSPIKIDNFRNFNNNYDVNFVFL